MSAHPMLRLLEPVDVVRPYGFVRKIAPGVVEATGPAGALGELCDVECESAHGEATVVAEIAAVDEDGVVLIPLEQQARISPDARVLARPLRDRVGVGDGFSGRAVDALGRPIDGRGAILADDHVSIGGVVPAPLDRSDPSRPLPTGLRAIDGLLTLGEGQRVGIFAASGVGKTNLVEQLAVQMRSDRCVLCLVGERGREVESIWRKLSAREDSARYTLVAATSDESAALRARAANYALCLADYWRARGEHVLLLVDSVTRLAMALREIGLAAGAPPTVRAYTPNVFSALPRLVERCGATRSSGAITAVMTILSETDDVDDPIVELMKSLLDGHIILSRSLAEQGHFPAIDVVRSVSRGADRLVPAEQVRDVRETVAMLSAYEDARMMIETGVYKAGTNATVDRAIAAKGDLTAFLRQSREEEFPFDRIQSSLSSIVKGGAVRHGR
jgi:flagellum-specific ATP synthase